VPIQIADLNVVYSEIVNLIPNFDTSDIRVESKFVKYCLILDIEEWNLLNRRQFLSLKIPNFVTFIAK
jgi:hypothetical protein